MTGMPPPVDVPIRVRKATDADRVAWDNYVFGHSDATAYHRWAWRDLLAITFGHGPHYLVAEAGTHIVGILPLVQVRSRLFGHSFVSLPFCPYVGPLSVAGHVTQALVDAAAAQASEAGAGHLELRGFGPPDRGWPTQELYVAFSRPISADHERNLNAIPRKQRAMVRKGVRNGLTDRIGDLDAFFALYADNVHRHGTPGQAKAFFERLIRAFGTDCEVLTVHGPGGEPISGVVSLYFRDRVLPFFAGDTVAARDLAANDFKYWRVMQRAAERGCTTFDFGRSKKETGPYHFKKNWGFEPTQLYYEYLLLGRSTMPQNNPLNPKYRLMIETWRRLPRAVVGWLGPRIVGGLG